MSSISMSSGDGSRRSSLRPDSMRCHARGAAASALALTFVIWRPAPLLPRSREGGRDGGDPQGGSGYMPPLSSRFPGRASEHLCHLVLKTLDRRLDLWLARQDLKIRRGRLREPDAAFS